MLSRVSWGEFFGAVVVLLVIYYSFIGIKFYKEELKSLFNGKLTKKNKNAVQEKPTNRFKDAAITEAAFEELETVVNDLRRAVLDKAGRQVTKQQLLALLQRRLADYTGLQKPAFRVAVNNYIITNAKEICGVVFSVEELNAAWDALPR